MAFTGDLEQLHIVDIIQLLNTTRKSGTFSVKGNRGESRIIFSNGYIVGATHLGKVRIGTVLVKTGAITLEDLNKALDLQKKAGNARKPLLATLMDMGRLDRDAAFRGLRKLIEITMVELVGWTKGSFTLDSEVVTVSPECIYPLSKMDQEISLDAQMVLMDALRLHDERERDRQTGMTVQPDEELFSDVIPFEGPAGGTESKRTISAEDLGLGDLDALERKIPQAAPATEFFDPVEIHRDKIRDLLSDLPAEEREVFVSFLNESASTVETRAGSSRFKGRTRALVVFSPDELLRHSIMTICKEEGVLVFTTEDEDELYRIIDQCISIKVMPVLVFDAPEGPDGPMPRERVLSLRQKTMKQYPEVDLVQLSAIEDYPFFLQSFNDGAKAVLPRPIKKPGKGSFIDDTISFLQTFREYIRSLFEAQKDLQRADDRMVMLREHISSFRSLTKPADLPLALLQYMAGTCERAVSFLVRQKELQGDKAIGVYDKKSSGPTSVSSLKPPLSGASLLNDVIKSGRPYYGEMTAPELTGYLYEAIGEPLSRKAVLVPVRSMGKTVAMIYADFGVKEAAQVDVGTIEVLCLAAEIALDNMFYRKKTEKGAS